MIKNKRKDDSWQNPAGVSRRALTLPDCCLQGLNPLIDIKDAEAKQLARLIRHLKNSRGCVGGLQRVYRVENNRNHHRNFVQRSVDVVLIHHTIPTPCQSRNGTCSSNFADCSHRLSSATPSSVHIQLKL